MNQTFPSGPEQILPAAEGGVSEYWVMLATCALLGKARAARRAKPRTNFITSPTGLNVGAGPHASY
jgi:hypothetical protein